MGFVIWIFGPPGSGKTTLAKCIQQRLSFDSCFLVDGDYIRKKYDNDIGYSPFHRFINHTRICNEIQSSKAPIRIASVVSPYKTLRNYVREVFRKSNLKMIELGVRDRSVLSKRKVYQKGMEEFEEPDFSEKIDLKLYTDVEGVEICAYKVIKLLEEESS